MIRTLPETAAKPGNPSTLDMGNAGKKIPWRCGRAKNETGKYNGRRTIHAAKWKRLARRGGKIPTGCYHGNIAEGSARGKGIERTKIGSDEQIHVAATLNDMCQETSGNRSTHGIIYYIENGKRRQLFLEHRPHPYECAPCWCTRPLPIDS